MLCFICGAIVALLATAYYVLIFLQPKYDYFKKRGIPQLKTELFFGNSRELALGKKTKEELYRDFYFKFKKMGASHGGVYESRGKAWVPVDPEIVKNVLTKDFLHFSAHNRKIPGLFFNNLFHMDGEEWRDMRKKLTPTFTSGKMKMMYDIILIKTNGLANHINKISETGEPFNITEVLIRYTLDIIANCGFGIESQAIEGINSEFYKQVIGNFNENKKDKRIIKSPLFQYILQYFGLGSSSIPNFTAIADFFREVVRETLEYREKNQIIRKDFVHLMIQLKNKGVVTELTNETEDVYKKTVTTEVMSLEDIAGQCLLFLSAGFGTSSSAMAFAMLELAHNQDVQKKLREEVREVLKRHNGTLTYEAVQELTYCQNVIYETLRKYPTLPNLFRLCTKEYRIPGTDSIIEKGTNVQIPVWGLHMDPDNFPDPEKFIPDRFNVQNKDNIKDFTFLPFGEGPRMCLGLRFGMMQSKAGLAALVNNFNFTLNEKTPFPPSFSKNASGPEEDKDKIWLDVVKIN